MSEYKTKEEVLGTIMEVEISSCRIIFNQMVKERFEHMLMLLDARHVGGTDSMDCFLHTIYDMLVQDLHASMPADARRLVTLDKELMVKK